MGLKNGEGSSRYVTTQPVLKITPEEKEVSSDEK